MRTIGKREEDRKTSSAQAFVVVMVYNRFEGSSQALAIVLLFLQMTRFGTPRNSQSIY
jgi:hypothetical protein